MERGNDYISSEYDKYDVFDMGTFEILKSQSDGDRLIVREVYLSYFSEAEILVKLINDHFKKGNYKKLKAPVHSLAGISATVGATKLMKVANDIENSIITNNLEEVSLLVPTLVSFYHEFKRVINQMI